MACGRGPRAVCMGGVAGRVSCLRITTLITRLTTRTVWSRRLLRVQSGIVMRRSRAFARIINRFIHSRVKGYFLKPANILASGIRCKRSLLLRKHLIYKRITALLFQGWSKEQNFVSMAAACITNTLALLRLSISSSMQVRSQAWCYNYSPHVPSYDDAKACNAFTLYYYLNKLSWSCSCSTNVLNIIIIYMVKCCAFMITV